MCRGVRASLSNLFSLGSTSGSRSTKIDLVRETDAESEAACRTGNTSPESDAAWSVRSVTHSQNDGISCTRAMVELHRVQDQDRRKRGDQPMRTVEEEERTAFATESSNRGPAPKSSIIVPSQESNPQLLRVLLALILVSQDKERLHVRRLKTLEKELGRLKKQTRDVAKQIALRGAKGNGENAEGAGGREALMRELDGIVRRNEEAIKDIRRMGREAEGYGLNAERAGKSSAFADLEAQAHSELEPPAKIWQNDFSQPPTNPKEDGAHDRARKEIGAARDSTATMGPPVNKKDKGRRKNGKRGRR